MRHWQNIVIKPETPILEAIKIIDKEGLRTALIVNDSGQLLGMVTDGDIRRSILNNINLNDAIQTIMNRTPHTAYVSDDKQRILKRLQSQSIYHMPIVDQDHKLVGLETLDQLLAVQHKNNLVIIMAGGMGKRLHPLTIDTPKPLLKVGDKPVLELVIQNFIDSGFRHFCIAINYKAEMIKQYFGDGSRWDIEINYLQETKRLGTAGALSLLNASLQEAVFVVNADVVTNIDYRCLLDFHQESQVAATLCIRQHEQVIPYGVVYRDEQSNHLVNIIEKPVRQFFVNAGIYLLEPNLLQLLKPNTYYDMPDFLISCVNHHYKIATFPIREYWMDIGRHEDLEQAHHDYEKVFSHVK